MDGPRPLWCPSQWSLTAGSSSWWALGWLVPLALQLAHAAAVAPTYHVGSFDDDANYLMAAHVLAAGGGLTAKMASGATVVANYLPGYPALLVPLVWLFGSALWAPRLFSALCVAALYPLMWAWMGRRGVRPSYRVAVLGILALNVVLATYATMVMAEAPFVLVLVLAIVALDQWERRPGWKWATVSVLLLAELVWLKEAGIGFGVGLGAYQLWRRRWRRAAGVTLGMGALLLPGLLARWLTGGVTIGGRYADEINDSSQGGLLHQLPNEALTDIWSYLRDVLRQSVLPSGSPVPSHGPVHLLVVVIGVTVPIFTVVGAAVWYGRHATPELWMVGAYFVETLGYPFNNQRRVILVLPLVTMWYVMGACVAGRAVLALSGRALGQVGLSVAVIVAVLAAGVPTAFGFDSNYLFGADHQSSEFARSPAMSLLRFVGSPASVVETDYRGSVAYFSDHRTAWTAFVNTTPYGPFAAQNKGACNVSFVNGAFQADHASFLVTGDFNFPGVMDSPCLLNMASSPRTAAAIGAVRLLSSRHDDTSVFELLGPGTSQPGLVDRTAFEEPTSQPGRVALAPNGQGDAGGTGYVAPSVSGHADVVWTWAVPEPLFQVSVGSVTAAATGTTASGSAVAATAAATAAAAATGMARPVTETDVAIELPDGTWRTLASSAGPVGDGGAAPYLLADPPAGTKAIALRVSARTAGAAEVSYVNAIGPPT